jgi:hypothetical protein
VPTLVASVSSVMMEDIGHTADVQGFTDALDSLMDIPIGTCATAIDIAATQTIIIAVFHESLYFGGRLRESLLNPNQCQAYGLPVNMCPWCLPFRQRPPRRGGVS